MNPTKKKPAKRRPAKYGPSFTERNPVLSKLLDLQSVLQKAYEEKRGRFLDADKVWVMDLINDVRHNSITKLCKEDMQACNRIWRDYERKQK